MTPRSSRRWREVGTSARINFGLQYVFVFYFNFLLRRYGGTDGDGRYLSFLIDILLLHAIHKGAYEVVLATGLLNIIIDRHECRRAQYWEDPANDPRWNKDHFQFSPKLERAAGEGYERLSVGSSVGSRCGYWAVIGHMLPQY